MKKPEEKQHSQNNEYQQAKEDFLDHPSWIRINNLIQVAEKDKEKQNTKEQNIANDQNPSK
ncbi:hypothetical protein [Flocculibacter collagenilyticus]|uniref:hypothetical protein n=1 Tax=Flocculibacter collagenilyticus TaxID=2744479 RepID=UPI0018F47488|nr:hypothetical protein [Flocculibacter collagenilyticus]